MRKAQNAEKPEGGRGLTVEEYQRREASIKEAVKAGKVSRDVAAKRLAGLQKMVRGKPEGKAPEGKGKNNGGAAKYRAMEEEIWAEVKKGQMSKEDAMEKLGQLKKEMFGGEKKGKGNEGAAKFRAMEEEIWAEVKKGEMSKEDAMEKLGQLKEEMFGGKGK